MNQKRSNATAVVPVHGRWKTIIQRYDLYCTLARGSVILPTLLPAVLLGRLLVVSHLQDCVCVCVCVCVHVKAEGREGGLGPAL